MDKNEEASSASETPLSEAMTKGIMAMLGPVVMDMDKAIIATQKSQNDLSNEIGQLLQELESFHNAVEPPRIQPALDKLADARKRLTVATKLMQQTFARVQRIEAHLEQS